MREFQLLMAIFGLACFVITFGVCMAALGRFPLNNLRELVGAKVRLSGFLCVLIGGGMIWVANCTLGLTEKKFDRIRLGMREDEVAAILGEEGLVPDQSRGEWATPFTYVAVYFDDQTRRVNEKIYYTSGSPIKRVSRR
jgi:hypothetical protein